MEQTVTVDPLRAALCQLDGRRHKAVSADDLEVFFIPQDQMQIVVVIPVDIPPFAAAFPDRAEGNFPQASQLAQQRRPPGRCAARGKSLCRRRCGPAFGLVQFAFEQRPVFRTGDGAFGFKPPRQPFAQLFKVLIAAAGKLASAGLRIEPVRRGSAGRYAPAGCCCAGETSAASAGAAAGCRRPAYWRKTGRCCGR